MWRPMSLRKPMTISFELDFNGLDESDVNGMTLLTGEDGTFTLYIEATSPTTGLSDFWRTSIQLYQ